MKFRMLAIGGLLQLLLCCLAQAQTGSSAVPRLVKYSGHMMDARGRAISGLVSVTFAIYKDQDGGAPLWLETQNIQTDGKGTYTVQLGATSPQGLPLDVFASGDARWLGVRATGEEEQPRVFLLSVPYALKAEDAQTLGGLPASAFALAGAAGLSPQASTVSTSSTSSGAAQNVGGSGTQNYLPLWTDNNGDLGNSSLYQTGSGSSAKVGINEKNPLLTLDVNGSELVRGLFELATQNYANKNRGYNSQPLNLESSAFNSGTQKYALNHFQWQAEPVGNNTTNPGATLNLLYGTDPSQPAETGLSLNSQGVFTFASGQTFPGAGTITAVNAGLYLTGGGSSGSVTLNVDATKVATLNNPNTFTQSQTVNSMNGIYPALKALGFYAGLEGDGDSAGVIGNSSDPGFGIGVNGTASSGAGYGVWGNNASTGTGVYGTASGNTASGVAGKNSGYGYGVSGTGNNGPGVYGVSTTNSGVYGSTSGDTGAGVWGASTSSDGIGVYGQGGGWSFVANGNVSQPRNAGGWVKAMVYVDDWNEPFSIVRCFNSTLAGSAATSPPCGFSLVVPPLMGIAVDFGFKVDDRFLTTQPTLNSTFLVTCVDTDSPCYSGKYDPTPNQVLVLSHDSGGNAVGNRFYLFVY